jgi:4-amino-4-deoxy-L-arabinose transferase
VTPPPAGSVPGGRYHLRTWAACAVVAVVWLAGLTYPLLESTEGRYASVAAEMAWSGNWMDPAFNGLPHFTKPPLAYWFGALGVSVFGESAFAVRLPATFALAACGFLVWRLGRRLGLNGSGSAGAAVMALLSPLAVAQGRITSSDIFLWMGVLAFYLGLLEPEHAGTRNTRRALLAGFGLGWGFLAKGPPVLLWTLLPVVALAVLHRVRGERERHSPWRLSRMGSPAALGLALLIALPWYVIEVVRHPGLLGYWLGSETADRFLTTTHGRSEPFWYFAALLPGVALPWLPELVRGGRRAARRAGPWLLVFLWALLPVVALSFSGSKRPNYLLPATAPLALLAGFALERGVPRAVRIRLGIWTVLVLLFPAVMFLDLGVAPPTRDLAAVIRETGRPALLYRTLPSSLPFYLGRAVPMVGVGRPHSFGSDGDAAGGESAARDENAAREQAVRDENPAREQAVRGENPAR